MEHILRANFWTFSSVLIFFCKSRLGWHILSGDVPWIHTVGVGSASLHIGSIFCTIVPAVSLPYCI